MAKTSNKARVLPDLASEMARMQQLVERLAAENEALKKAPHTGKILRGVTRETFTDNKGKSHEMIGFDVGGMPFSLSFKKCRTVLDNADKVRAIIGKGK